MVQSFDWQAYRKAQEERESVWLGYASYHRSCQNMSMYGQDEDGFWGSEEYEGEMWQRNIKGAEAAIEALGEPPCCPDCNGSGKVWNCHEYTNQYGEVYDSWCPDEMSTCPRCGGGGHYYERN